MRKSAVLLFALLGLFASLGLVLAQEAEPPAPEKEPGPKPDQPQPPAAKPVGGERLDIIFAIDASGSMKWTDPSSFRKTVAHSFISLVRHHGGDRVAVVQFAGWDETSRAGSLIYKLTSIPKVAKLRKVLLPQIEAAINTKLGSFGTATDFNFAFERAVKEILDQRAQSEEKNKIWLILVSDGSMEVVEGNDVREAYRSRLMVQGKGVNRANLNQAAIEMFTDEVLPKIAANRDMFVTCINLGAGEPSDILVKISELPNGQLLRTSDENLKTVLIEAFMGLPGGFQTYGVPEGFGYLKAKVAAGSAVASPFHIYQGASTTRLLLLGSTRDFKIDIKNEAGVSILDKASVVVHGKGGSHRLVSIADEVFGDYTLEVTNSSDSTGTFELLECAEFDLDAFVGVAGLKSEFYPGNTIDFEVGLRETSTSAFVTDPALISEAVGLLLVTDVDGSTTEDVVTFAGLQTAKASAQYSVPDDAPGGEYELLVRLGAIKETVSGRYAFVSEPVRITFSVLSPVVDLHFAREEVFIGQPVEVVGTVATGSLTGKQKQEGIKAKVVHVGSRTEKEVELTWDEESGQLHGTIALDEMNEWQIEKSPLGTGQMKPAEPEQVVVKPRGVRVLQVGEDGKRVPVETLRLKGKLEEAVIANLLVEADLAPGETGGLDLKPFDKIMEEADVSIALSGKTEPATLITGEDPSAILTLTLTLNERPEEGDVGELVVTAKLPGVTVEKKVHVTTEIPPKPFPWHYVAIGAGVALLLLIILALLLGGPRFDQQQLYIVGGDGHHLKEWKTGRKSALGTVEVPGTLHFRLKGSKAEPTCMVMSGKGNQMFVNNIECIHWTAVHHGDYVEVFPAQDEFSYRYRYFERTPTAEELEAAVEVTQEIGDGVFLGEDEFILAEDEDELGAAAGGATQALLEQARRMKERMESEPTEILIQSSEQAQEPAAAPADEAMTGGETELVREAAQMPADQDFTEAMPTMPEEPTEALAGESFEDEEAFFEEIEDAPVSAAEGFELPLSEDVLESEPTQAIGADDVALEEMGEPTQAIVPEDEHEEALITEPTEEMSAAQEPVEELTELVEERLEMSEFIEEEETSGPSLADELDKTFDQILGEEDQEKEL